MSENENNKIVVSILCIAYNHEKYIAQAIDGFLMQETDFEFEILIHDDASTDKTASIIQNYADRYPGVINTVLQKENQLKKGIKAMNLLIKLAKGKYIAFCEGDDYWTDRKKLAKQVKILENNSECVACCHNENVVKEDGSLWPSSYQQIYSERTDKILCSDKLLEYCKYAHTASIVMKRSIFSDMSVDCWNEYLQVMANGDLKWSALIAANGNCYHIAENMACYRFVTSGNDSWTARNQGKNIRGKTLQQLMDIRAFCLKFYSFDPRYTNYLLRIANESVLEFIKHPSHENRAVIRQFKEMIDYSWCDFMVYVFHRIKNKIKKCFKRCGE